MPDLNINGNNANSSDDDIEKIGYNTPATYESLQDQMDEVKENLTTLEEKLNDILIYSTEETKTDKKWLNNEDIYSRILIIENPTKNIIVSLSTPIKNMVRADIFVERSDGYIYPPDYASTVANVGKTPSGYLYYYVQDISSTPAVKIQAYIEYVKP